MSKLNVLEGTDICDTDYSSHYNDSNENSANEIEDNTDDFNLLINEKKHHIDSSSDESQKTDAYEQSCNIKNGKKPYKPKVKIKTLTIDGQLVYFCKICDKIFTRRKDKLNHELAHSGESMLTCNECGKEYLHESSLASHMRTHDGDPLFMCDLCPKMFAQSHHLKSHILSHSEPTNFVCKTCYMEFATASDLNHHCRIQIKMEITKLWCKMCKVFFCRNHDKATERRIHAFCCSACNELFYTSKKLKIHMKKFAHHSIERQKYIEPLQEYELYPDKVSESIRKLQVQKDYESVKNPEKRDKQQCDVNFEDELPAKKFKLSPRKVFLEEEHSSTSLQDSTPEIKKEIDIKSPTKHRKGKPYCKKCNKSFKDSVDLDRHRALVHEEKNDKSTCGTCNMGFMTKRELENHSLKHACERLHSCPMCVESFSCSLELTKHLKAHVGDFPYKCSQCGKAFRLKIQLIQHVRLHVAQDAKLVESSPGKNTTPTNLETQGEHPQVQGEGDVFKCHLCSKAFHFRYKLLNHLRLHTNVKCFQCYICHKAFATKHYLQRHLQVHVKQGMDVDVQNIIIDKDSKTELDSVRTQMTRDNSQHKDEQVQFKDRFECQNFMRKRKVSVEMEANQNLSRKTDLYQSMQESKFSIYKCDNIKMESQDGSDSGSGHSCCSSLTRDSDRSDPFRFSSDGSNSFKTTMAKERRRLKRRWFRQMKRKHSKLKRASSHLNQISCLSLVKEKDDEEEEDDDDDVLDMMVELNGVHSEKDNVMTVFVDLTHMRSTQQPFNSSKPVTGFETNKEEVIHRNNLLSELPLLSTAIKLETEWQGDAKFPDIQSSSSFQEDMTLGENNLDIVTKKTLLFEIDAELLENEHFDWQIAVDEISNDAAHTCVDSKTKTTKVTSQKETKFFERAFSESFKTHSPDESQKSSQHAADGLKFASSDLEKLKAAFECSSKYLPVSESSTVPVQSSPSPAQKLQFQKSTSDSNVQDPMATAVGQVSQRQSMNKKHSHFSSPSHSKHISVLSISDNSKKEVVQKDIKTLHSELSFTDSRQKSSTQGTPKSHTKTPPTLSASGQTVCRVSSNHLCTSTYSSEQGHITKVTSSNVPKMAASIMPTVTISHCSTISDTVLTCAGTSDTQITTNKVNVFGSQECNKPNLNVNPHPVHSSDVNIISFNNPGSLQNPMSILDPHLTTTDHSLNQKPKAELSHSASFTGNSFFTSVVPPANSAYSLGLNGSQANTPLHINPDQGNFALNISSIFDTNNPVLRNMNMMDLVSPSHSAYSQNLSVASSQPQPLSVYSQNMSVASSQPQPLSVYSQNMSVASSQPQGSVSSTFEQNSMEAQMRHSLVTMAELQSASLQPHNTLMNVGNPYFGMPLGNSFQNALNQSFDVSAVSLNSGSLESMVLSMTHPDTSDLNMQLRSIQESAYRESYLGANIGFIPSLPVNINPYGGTLSLNPAIHFSSSSGSYGGTTASLGGQGFLNLCSQAVHVNSGLPMSISTGHHLANITTGISSGFTQYPLMGLQDSLTNTSTPFGINILNPSMSASGGVMTANPLSVMGNFNTGYFTNFP